MGYTTRVSLPDFNAGTDTNYDNYSLYADDDNVLIKNKETGTANIGSAVGGSTTVTHTHSLSYVPFYAVYARTNYYGDNRYIPVNNQYNVFEVPDIISATDGTKVSITNFQGTQINYGYDIFYDNMSQTGTPSISQSTYAFKVTRPGKDGTSTNPNDYIMHSDLNNFKILKQGTSLANGDGTVTHSAVITTPYKYFSFLKFPDGKTAITGWALGLSYDATYGVKTSLDGTNLYFEKYRGGTFAGTSAYVIYGSGTTGVPSGYVLAVSKEGKNALTDTNPDNYNFHSNYNSLKYYNSGSIVMTNISSTTYGTIAHNLGYTPFFVAFVNDLSVYYSANAYAMVPYYLGSSTIPNPNRNLGAFAYADSTNVYCKAWFDTNWVGTHTFTFYYKIFRNNLNI